MFVVLHPTSVYAMNPDWVIHSTRTADGFHKGSRCFPLSVNSHQLAGNAEFLFFVFRNAFEIEGGSRMLEVLCYAQMLETNKPYLLNLVRVPSLQTCLLFGDRSTSSPFPPSPCPPPPEDFVF
jgi:hypothetical protein